MPTPTQITLVAAALAQRRAEKTYLPLIEALTARIAALEATVAAFTATRCHRCGRTGHWASTCYATTHANGSDLDSGDSEYNSE